MNRQQRRAAKRSETNRQNTGIPPAEWAAMNHRQRRDATERRGR